MPWFNSAGFDSHHNKLTSAREEETGAKRSPNNVLDVALSSDGARLVTTQ